MLRRDKADELYSIVINRYAKEKPEIVITTSMMDNIWYAIYGELCRNGEESARNYVENVKLAEM